MYTKNTHVQHANSKTWSPQMINYNKHSQRHLLPANQKCRHFKCTTIQT